MSWLTISMLANGILFFTLVGYGLIYPKLIREAKVETFSAIMGHMAYGLAMSDPAKRYDRLGFSLSQMLGRESKEEVSQHLERMSTFGYFGSKEPSLIDLLPERDRLSCVRLAQRHGFEDGKLEKMWQYVASALALQDGFIEPVQRFSGEDLKKGQIWSEAKLIEMYECALKKAG